MSLVLHSLLVLSMNQWTIRVHFDTVTLDNDRHLTSADPLLNI